MTASSPALLGLGALVGACVGSFVGATSIRLPQKVSILAGRSHCDSCDRQLRALELLPIVSHLLLRGRCRRCCAPIASDHLIAELGGTVVGLLAVEIGTTPASMLLTAVFGWTLLLLALLDWRQFWLPDLLTLPLISLGLVGAALVGMDVVLDRLVAALIGFVILEGVRRGYRVWRGREGLGGGDPKLLAGLGAWFGTFWLPWLLLGAAALGLTIMATANLLGQQWSSNRALPFGSLLGIASLVGLTVQGTLMGAL